MRRCEHKVAGELVHPDIKIGRQDPQAATGESTGAVQIAPSARAEPRSRRMRVCRIRPFRLLQPGLLAFVIFDLGLDRHRWCSPTTRSGPSSAPRHDECVRPGINETVAVPNEDDTFAERTVSAHFLIPE